MNKTRPALVIGTITLTSLRTVGCSLNTLGISEESLRQTLRETARISTLIFILVFITSPLHKLIKNNLSTWLMVHRRYLGISFGISHLIHLGLILFLMSAYSNGELLKIASVSTYAVGGIGYALIFAMLATSNNRSVKYLGHKRWKKLHTFGMYYLLLAFLSSYVGLLEKDVSFYAPIVLSLVLACLIRAFALFSNTTNSNSTNANSTHSNSTKKSRIA